MSVHICLHAICMNKYVCIYMYISMYAYVCICIYVFYSCMYYMHMCALYAFVCLYRRRMQLGHGVRVLSALDAAPLSQTNFGEEARAGRGNLPLNCDDLQLSSTLAPLLLDIREGIHTCDFLGHH